MNPKSIEKYLYVTLSGVMLTASFPPGKLDWLAWFALVPLLKGLERASASRAFRLGLLAGFAHYITLIYWVVVVLEHYGNIHLFVSLSILVIFCLYLSLYLALFSYAVSYFRGSRFVLFKIASLWVGLEYVRAKVLTGFPWCLLGYTQYQHLELIQIADLVGVYGLSFILVLSNGLIYALLFGRNFEKKGSLKWEIPVIALIAFFTLGYSHQRLSERTRGETDQEPAKIAIIQGNIDQSIKWHPAYQEKTIQIYRNLTRAASSFRPDLIVWPETSVPFFFQDNLALAYQVIQVTRESGADLIFGSPAYRKENGLTTFYNRAFHLSPKGRISGYYDKVHLVPFGEYVPLRRFLPFVNRLVVSTGDFAPGEKIVPLELSRLSAGILICFEIIFPELARAHVKNGADLLVNLTNDAWYGMTSAPYQHFCMAVFRAVENGRPLVRSANTGFSGFITHRGKIVDHGELFTEEVLTQKIGPGDSGLTVYTRYGDFFAVFLLGIGLINFFYVLCYSKILVRME
ncbi:MAG: apolipoprotein N-acyltransferase [Desulfobacteraceae bacterium]|jgi:apolipoprotein N-acyltransferase